jgi:hypothetical protein
MRCGIWSVSSGGTKMDKKMIDEDVCMSAEPEDYMGYLKSNFDKHQAKADAFKMAIFAYERGYKDGRLEAEQANDGD